MWSKVWRPKLDYCNSLPNVLRTAISFAVIYRCSSLLESLQWLSIVSKFTNFSMDLRSSIMCSLANFSDSSYLDWLLLLYINMSYFCSCSFYMYYSLSWPAGKLFSFDTMSCTPSSSLIKSRNHYSFITAHNAQLTELVTPYRLRNPSKRSSFLSCYLQNIAQCLTQNEHNKLVNKNIGNI